jgi:hypothetical protein
VAVEELRLDAVQGELKAAKTNAEANLLLLNQANRNVESLNASVITARGIVDKRQRDADKIDQDRSLIFGQLVLPTSAALPGQAGSSSQLRIGGSHGSCWG